MFIKLGVQAVVLSLLLLGQISEGSILGASVNIEPLDQDGSLTQVKAYYSVVSSLPCPFLDGVCDGEDCTSPVTCSPLTGLLPSPGWCLCQWKKTISKNYTSTLHLHSGSDESVLLYTRADLSIRADTDGVNQPPCVALPPPIRLKVSERCGIRSVLNLEENEMSFLGHGWKWKREVFCCCANTSTEICAGVPREIPLNVIDLDGDEVRCRYGVAGISEFLQLNEETCTLLYEGGALLGHHSVDIILEDFPQFVKNEIQEAKPFSTVSLYLSITVENGLDCSAVPQFTVVSPVGVTVVHVLPFEEVTVNITVYSKEERVREIAVIGPHDLFILPMESDHDSKTSVRLSWVRATDQFARLLSICFAANTESLQSEIRCMWLQQSPIDPLPPGTELKCNERELKMSLVLPVFFLENLWFSGLQLNDATCQVFYNTTHVTTTFSLIDCGTKRVHSGSELIYTNTLRSVNPKSTISRTASLIFPLVCRIPAQEAKGPNFKLSIPSEEETFGAVSFWLEFYLPGEGPLAAETRQPRLRSLQSVRAARELRRIGRLEVLDLHVFSNCSLTRAELMVGRCVESEREDFSYTQPLLNHGCEAGNGTFEILTSTPNVRIYRLHLGSLAIKGDTMYVECKVHLCVTTKASQKCSDPCTESSNRTLVDSILTHTYTVRSGPVLLINKVTQSTTTTVKPAQSETSQTTASRAPDKPAFWAVDVIFLTLLMLSTCALTG